MTKDAVNTELSSGIGRWRVRDLIDLEYFLHREDHPGENDNRLSSVSKVREIYLSRLRHLGDGRSSVSRRRLIKGWLNIWREREAGPMPGAMYAEAGRMSLLVAAVLGLFAGTGLALSLLNYSGEQPLNVSIYLGAAVFSQVLLLLFLAAVLSLRAATRSLARNSVVVQLLGRMFTTAVLRVWRRTFESIDGRKRNALLAATGLVRGRKRIYGSLFFWPVFTLVQVFAVCFNVGLLGATLVKLSGSDVAFGWQSTFQISAGVVFHLVEAISLPWRWMVPPSLAYPSLEAIEGSRIILKEGISSLATGDLVSWWPFLCFSVFFYGFLPRLVLLVSGVMVQRRLLGRLRFDHGECDALVRKMISPLIRTEGTPVAPESQLSGEKVLSEKAVEAFPGGHYVALVPEEISAACEGLADVAARGLSVQVTDQKIFGSGAEIQSAIIDTLEEMQQDSLFAGVVVLQEAWQPPIQEMLLFLKRLRRRLGETARIVVALIGKPGTQTIFTPPREEDRQIWKHRIDALGDPYLGVERLVDHEA